MANTTLGATHEIGAVADREDVWSIGSISSTSDLPTTQSSIHPTKTIPTSRSIPSYAPIAKPSFRVGLHPQSQKKCFFGSQRYGSWALGSDGSPERLCAARLGPIRRCQTTIAVFGSTNNHIAKTSLLCGECGHNYSPYTTTFVDTVQVATRSHEGGSCVPARSNANKITIAIIYHVHHRFVTRIV